MTAENRRLHPSRVNHKRPKWLEKLSSPEMEEAIRKEAERIGNSQDPTPTVAEVRTMMDETLGDRALTEELYTLRGKG